MYGVLAENDPYLFITVCDHLELKWHPTIEGRRIDSFFSATLRKALTVITEHRVIRAVHSERVRDN